MVDAAQFEEQLGFGVEPHADAIHRGGDVLAHVRPVGAVAVEANFVWMREQPFVPVGDRSHDFVRDPALQQFDQRANLSFALVLDIAPFFGAERFDVDREFIHA